MSEQYILTDVEPAWGQDYRDIAGGEPGPAYRGDTSVPSVPPQNAMDGLTSNAENLFNNATVHPTSEDPHWNAMEGLAIQPAQAPLGLQNTANSSPHGDLGALLPEEGSLEDMLNQSAFSPVTNRSGSLDEELEETIQ